MWKFKVLLVFFLPPFTSTIAQEVLEFKSSELADKRFRVLELDNEIDHFSDVIENQLVDNFIFGGAIDRENLENMYASMNADNNFGVYANSNIRYRAFSDSIRFKKPTSLFLELGATGLAYSKFGKDMFYLPFIGNADRLGETMDLSDSKTKAMFFQYAGIGLMHENTGSYVSLNGVNIQSYYEATTNDFTLYTAPDATSVDINYSGEVTLSDSLSRTLFSSAGAGAMLNARYNVALKNKRDLFSAEVRNLGMALLNVRTQHLAADSSFSFSGVDITEVLSADNRLSNIALEDSIAYNQTLKRKTIFLPLDLNLRYFRGINKKDHLVLGLRQRFFSGYEPEVAFNYFHKETERIAVNLGISRGGYGGFRANAGVYYNSRNWQVYFSTQNLLSSFLRSGKGRSASFGLTKIFRSNS